MNIESSQSAPRAARSKVIYVFTIVVVLFAVGVLAVLLWSREGQRAAPRMLGSLWTALVGPQSRLLLVTEEERWERRIPNYGRRQYWFTVDLSVFRLQAHDAHTGEAAGVVELARIDQAVSGQGPEILGTQDQVVWLWNNGLEARNLDTLAPVLTPARLKELNPEYAALIPTERKYCKVLGPLRALVFRGQDARYFQVDPASGKFQPIADAELAQHFHTNRAADAFTYLQPDNDSLWSTSTAGLMWNALAVNDMWYALLTADERASLTSRPGKGQAPGGEVVRSLYRAQFELEDRPALQSKEILLHMDTLAAVGDARFVMGGFLRRPATGELWRLDGGKSCVVLHRQGLGGDNPWLVTRLGLDGAVQWTCSTGLAEIGHLADAGGTVVLTGFADLSQPTNRRPDLIVFIDETSGQIRRLNLVKNEVSSPESPAGPVLAESN